MMRACRYFVVIICGVILAAAAEPEYADKPKAGYVPDAETAIRIAVAVWEPIYGAEQIAHEKPYHVALHDDVWTVTGSIPEGVAGGVAIAKISKKDGRILELSHTM